MLRTGYLPVRSIPIISIILLDSFSLPMKNRTFVSRFLILSLSQIAIGIVRFLLLLLS